MLEIICLVQVMLKEMLDGEVYVTGDVEGDVRWGGVCYR